MEKYDIGNPMLKSYPLTIIDMCRELRNEFEEKYPNDIENWRDEETLRKLFSNSDHSGLIDKLKDKLNFDIEAIASVSDEEKFSELKLLKLLYYIEKDGQSKNSPVDIKERRIPIIDILAKPRLENIDTDFSKKSVYGGILKNCFEQVRREVPDADERDKKLNAINEYWEYIIHKMLDYVISDKALSNKEDAMDELNRLHKFLKEKILDRLSDIPLSTMQSKENIMGTFYNILSCHRFLCNDVDRLNINYRICIEEPPAKEFIDQIKKYEKYSVIWKTIDDLENLICKGKMDDDIITLLRFINYGISISKDDLKAYRFAIKNLKNALKLWLKGVDDKPYWENVPVDTLVIILQEMIAVHKHREGFKNDYWGYNNSNRSLSVAVKKPNEADAVAVQAWVKKIENRTVVNYGGYELIEKKREIENTVFQIKQIIYSYQNLEDLEFVNKILSHLAARSLMSRDMCICKEHKFVDKIHSQLIGKAKNIQFMLPLEAVNVYDMFREFYVDIHNIEDKVADDIARQINEFYASKDESIVVEGMRCDFEICTSEICYRDFVLTFMVYRYNNKFFYQKFFEISPAEECERMKQIGLGKFVIDE